MCLTRNGWLWLHSPWPFTFTCMFTLVLLCFSVIQINWFEFNLPSLCKVDTPRSSYCRSSLLTLQGVVLLLWLVLWLVMICGYCALIKWTYNEITWWVATAVGVTYYSSETYLSTQNTNTQSHQTNCVMSWCTVSTRTIIMLTSCLERKADDFSE